MMFIKRDMPLPCKKNDDLITKGVVGMLAISSLACAGAAGICCYEGLTQKPPIYRDVNGDGIEDKIVSHTIFEDEVFFGC